MIKLFKINGLDVGITIIVIFKHNYLYTEKMFPDSLDLRILKALQDDSRRSVRELAKELNESPSTLYNRVKRLEAKSIIKKWTVELDYKKLDIDHVAFVFVTINTSYLNDVNQIEDVVDKISRVPGIQEMHKLSCEFDILVKIRGKCLKSINKLVIDKIRQIPGVSKTHPALSIETIIDEGELEPMMLLSESILA